MSDCVTETSVELSPPPLLSRVPERDIFNAALTRLYVFFNNLRLDRFDFVYKTSLTIKSSATKKISHRESRQYRLITGIAPAKSGEGAGARYAPGARVSREC